MRVVTLAEENILKTFLKQTKCPIIKGFKTFLKTF